MSSIGGTASTKTVYGLANTAVAEYTVYHATTSGATQSSANSTIPFGVAQETFAAAGAGIQRDFLIVTSGRTKVIAGGSINPGAMVMATTGGKVVTLSGDGVYVVGRYLGGANGVTACSGTGEVIEIEFSPYFHKTT